MKREQIVSILCELHNISGFRVSLHGTDFEEIAAYPTERLPFCSAIQKSAKEYAKCVACDSDACRRVEASGETLIYKCRYGLTEVICPLYNFGTLTGYIMMGQTGDEKIDTGALVDALTKINTDKEEAIELVGKITRIASCKLSSFVRIMTICAEYMTLTNAIPSRSPRIPELAKIYMHEHFGEKITIKDICKVLGCSKSALLTSFKAEYGTTLNSYLCAIRIEEAKRLLKTTNMTISAVAEATGFYDQSYFSKVFSSKLDITPSDYRKENAL
jgi:AraC-like DNA-binding protein